MLQIKAIHVMSFQLKHGPLNYLSFMVCDVDDGTLKSRQVDIDARLNIHPAPYFLRLGVSSPLILFIPKANSNSHR